MVQAHHSGQPSHGIKGVSPLYPLKAFNLVHGFPIDYMHACLLGVARMLANLWTDSSNHLMCPEDLAHFLIRFTGRRMSGEIGSFFTAYLASMGSCLTNTFNITVFL